jgi:multiple sugar transport system substrate-binding protein
LEERTKELLGLGSGKAANARTFEYWSFVIPKNARQKDLTWVFVRSLSKAGTLDMALNGNGPTRVSTFNETKIIEGLPFSDAQVKALAAARIHLPAFHEQALAQDIFVAESQAAMLGMKTPQAAMTSALQRVTPLVQSG